MKHLDGTPSHFKPYTEKHNFINKHNLISGVDAFRITVTQQPFMKQRKAAILSLGICWNNVNCRNNRTVTAVPSVGDTSLLKD